MATCKTHSETNRYYDIERLRGLRAIDRAVHFTRSEHGGLKKYHRASNTMRGFNDVTEDLVKSHDELGESFLRLVIKNANEYGLLFWFNDSFDLLNRVDVEYRDFPLVRERERVMALIEKTASRFFPTKGCKKRDMACLYLLYFFAMLVNPDSTWIMMDYLGNGNRNHQYLVSLYSRRE